MLKLLINCYIVKLLNEAKAKAEAKKGKAMDKSIDRKIVTLSNC